MINKRRSARARPILLVSACMPAVTDRTYRAATTAAGPDRPTTPTSVNPALRVSWWRFAICPAAVENTLHSLPVPLRQVDGSWASDEVDEHPKDRKQKNRNEPEGLGEATVVAAAEVVDKRPNDHEDHEDVHRDHDQCPNHAEQRIVICEHGLLLTVSCLRGRPYAVTIATAAAASAFHHRRREMNDGDAQRRLLTLLKRRRPSPDSPSGRCSMWRITPSPEKRPPGHGSRQPSPRPVRSLR